MRKSAEKDVLSKEKKIKDILHDDSNQKGGKSKDRDRQDRDHDRKRRPKDNERKTKTLKRSDSDRSEPPEGRRLLRDSDLNSVQNRFIQKFEKGEMDPPTKRSSDTSRLIEKEERSYLYSSDENLKPRKSYVNDSIL